MIVTVELAGAVPFTVVESLSANHSSSGAVILTSELFVGFGVADVLVEGVGVIVVVVVVSVVWDGVGDNCSRVDLGRSFRLLFASQTP